MEVTVNDIKAVLWEDTHSISFTLYHFFLNLLPESKIKLLTVEELKLNTLTAVWRKRAYEFDWLKRNEQAEVQMLSKINFFSLITPQGKFWMGKGEAPSVEKYLQNTQSR